MAKKPVRVQPPRAATNIRPEKKDIQHMSDEQYTKHSQIQEFMNKIDEVTKRTPNGKS